MPHPMTECASFLAIPFGDKIAAGPGTLQGMMHGMWYF